jgi:hypothetical protein
MSNPSTDPVNDPLVTKEGIRVEVGQLWRDLDKRMGDRVRKVVAIADPVNGKVRMEAATGRGRFPSVVSVRRMHKHGTGWSLVKGVAS